MALAFKASLCLSLSPVEIPSAAALSGGHRLPNLLRKVTANLIHPVRFQYSSCYYDYHSHNCVFCERTTLVRHCQFEGVTISVAQY